MEPLEKQIVLKAHELTEALKDFAYTRKDEDKKRVTVSQMELMKLCKSHSDLLLSSESTPS